MARRLRVVAATLVLCAGSACSSSDAPPASSAAAGSSGVGAASGIAGSGANGGSSAGSLAGGGAFESGVSGVAGEVGSASAGQSPSNGGAGNTGPASAGAAGSAASAGIAGAAGGAASPGSAGATANAGAGGASGSDCAASATGCGAVLYIGGAMPRVGVDLQLHQVLTKLNLQVEDARETALPAQATGKRLVVFSYSMSSGDFKAEDWAGLTVPIIVLEHYLLPRLNMTTAQGHGFEEPVTDLELTGDDPMFAAGVAKGKVTVYSQTGEFFWGVPAAGALTIATVVGKPTEPVTFGYSAGSMMVGRVAPAKRVQVFVAVHAPPPNPTQLLNENGLQLFGGAVTWAIH